jgi:predicted small secreted protein
MAWRELLFLRWVQGLEFTSPEITKMKKSMIAAMVAALLSTFVLAACNATEGLGQDIKGAGQGLSSEAAKDK